MKYNGQYLNKRDPTLESPPPAICVLLKNSVLNLTADKSVLLNKMLELITKLRHENKFYAVRLSLFKL